MNATAPVETLRHFAIELFNRAGLPPNHASICADNLLYANLRGIDGHGALRLPHYLDRIERRSTLPDVEPDFTQLAPAVGLVDARHGMGQVAGHYAMREARRLAQETGLAWVSVKNSGHFGAAGFYGQEAARAGFATVVLANTDKIVVPFGGRQAFFGSNPIAFILPGPGEPVTVDMATSAIPCVDARGTGAAHRRSPKQGRESARCGQPSGIGCMGSQVRGGAVGSVRGRESRLRSSVRTSDLRIASASRP